ncbi:MAG: ferredoxin domain-containing protein [Bacteroidota bacterium]
MITDQELIRENLKSVASRMIMAARTAPKARAKDYLFAAIFEEKEIQILAKLMIQKGQEKDLHFFERDGHNLETTEILVILGTSIKPLNLPECGFCGFENCDEKRKYPDVPCAFNTGDLGIAVGSAASVAMDYRADNRIMFTAGKAALEAGILPEDIKIAYGIPLSAGKKNPYFDRK